MKFSERREIGYKVERWLQNTGDEGIPVSILNILTALDSMGYLKKEEKPFDFLDNDKCPCQHVDYQRKWQLQRAYNDNNKGRG
jgi:hypothetical protein